VAKIRKITPDLDEGTFDERASKAFDVRADIRKLIENPDGSINVRALHDIAERNALGVKTVENFAYGQTKRPSTFTQKRMALESHALRAEKAGKKPVSEDQMVLALVPRDTEGVILLE